MKDLEKRKCLKYTKYPQNIVHAIREKSDTSRKLYCNCAFLCTILPIIDTAHKLIACSPETLITNSVSIMFYPFNIKLICIDIELRKWWKLLCDKDYNWHVMKAFVWSRSSDMSKNDHTVLHLIPLNTQAWKWPRFDPLYRLVLSP